MSRPANRDWRAAGRHFLGVLACATAPLSASTQARAAPLVGEWHLDSKHVVGADDVVDDTSGSGNHLLAPSGSVLIDTSLTKFGGALTTGSNSSLKSAGPGPSPTTLTLLAWIKQDGDPGRLKYIAGRGDDGPGLCLGSSYALYTGYSPDQEGLTFYVRTQGAFPAAGVFTHVPSNASVFDNQWHLIAGTFDGLNARLYVDDKLVSTVPVNAPIQYSLGGGGGSTFNIDSYPQPACGNTNFPGRIDEVRVYDDALTGTEIARLAAATGPTPPQLVRDSAPTPIASPTPKPAPATPTPAAQPDPGPVFPTPEAVTATLQQMAKAVASIEGTNLAINPGRWFMDMKAQIKLKLRNALLAARTASEVAKAERIKNMTPQERAKVKADEELQARMGAMKYGIGMSVPAPVGQVVEVVATVAVEKKERDGTVVRQQIVLPPAVGISEADGQGGEATAAILIPVDNRATEAMTKSDVASAVIASEAVVINPATGFPANKQQQIKKLLDANEQAKKKLADAVGDINDTQDQINANKKGGVTASERSEQKDLVKLATKQIKAATAFDKAAEKAEAAAAAELKELTRLYDAYIAELTRVDHETAALPVRGCGFTCRLTTVSSKSNA